MKKKKKKRIYRLFALTLICALFLTAGLMYFSKKTTNDNDQIKTEITDSFNTTQDQNQNSLNNTTQELSSHIYTKNNLPNAASLDVQYINQMPELPTGCEITSLTEVLNYLGFNLDKEDLIEKYLNYSYDVNDGIFMEYFFGSPYDPDACGCFSPVLLKVANDYLDDMNSPYKAHNLSYADPYSLFANVANGSPVIVWTSLDYSVRNVEYQTVYTQDDKTIDWPIYEHCVVLIGYDLDKGTVTFADPTYGIISHSIDDFIYFYGKYYYQAVVIR